MFQFTLQFLHIFIRSLCRGRVRASEGEIAAMHTQVVCYWMDFINFIRPSRAGAKRRRWWKRKARTEIKLQTIREKSESREEPKRCPICSKQSLQLQWAQENVFPAFKRQQQQPANSARNVIQFHILLLTQKYIYKKEENEMETVKRYIYAESRDWVERLASSSSYINFALQSKWWVTHKNLLAPE